MAAVCVLANGPFHEMRTVFVLANGDGFRFGKWRRFSFWQMVTVFGLANGGGLRFGKGFFSLVDDGFRVGIWLRFVVVLLAAGFVVAIGDGFRVCSSRTLPLSVFSRTC